MAIKAKEVNVSDDSELAIGYFRLTAIVSRQYRANALMAPCDHLQNAMPSRDMLRPETNFEALATKKLASNGHESFWVLASIGPTELVRAPLARRYNKINSSSN
jgi:hypothetical protein